MKKVNTAIFLLALSSTPAFADDCAKPAAPVLPDGSSAAMEDMLAGQKGVKTFQAANLEYMACLEKAFTAAESEAKAGTDEASKQAAQARYDQAVDAYNAAVSEEEDLAGQFNTEIREYKAAQAK